MIATLGYLLGVPALVYLGIKVFAPWLVSDIAYMRTAKGANDRWEAQHKQKKFIIDVFEETVKKFSKKTMLIFEDREYTFEYMNKMANQVAQTALKIGLRQGDLVAMLQFNEPAFIWTYLGFQKIGVQIAFINYNLRSKSLLHCMKASEAKLLVIGEGADLQNAVLDIQGELKDVEIYSQNSDVSNLPPGFKSFVEAMRNSSSDPPDKSHRANLTYELPYVLIYTSGTTGATMVLRSKFSATHFWEDCRKHNVTIIHYVGELCRYLVARPKSPDDGIHKVRCAFGNGLRQDVWKQFQSRFNIPQITEFYAATEMPLGFINITNTFGAVGRSSPLLRKLIPCSFVQFDYQAQEPKRNNNGRCIACKTDEVGLLIIPLTKEITFEGYKGRKEETEKKILRDVFVEGDRYVNSGDLLYVDKNYDIFFNDRVGDTFRWKGENVSTTEVANAISALHFVHDATVYGVTVPGCEGRAGMASVCLKEPGCKSLSRTQLAKIWTQCLDLLPSYARPRFIRLQEEMDLTSTFKQRKMKFLEEGFDVNKVNAEMYYYNDNKAEYSVLDKQAYSKIMDKEISL